MSAPYGKLLRYSSALPAQCCQDLWRSTQQVRVGDEGWGATFRFCPKCGARVYYANAGDEETIAIPVGAFADFSFPELTVSVYEERMHSWVHMPSGMEHISRMDQDQVTHCIMLCS